MPLPSSRLLDPLLWSQGPGKSSGARAADEVGLENQLKIRLRGEFHERILQRPRRDGIALYRAFGPSRWPDPQGCKHEREGYPGQGSNAPCGNRAGRCWCVLVACFSEALGFRDHRAPLLLVHKKLALMD